MKDFEMTKKGIDNMNLRNLSEEIENGPHSLADLLADKDWCIAVWGKGKYELDMQPREDGSLTAFEILQESGKEKAIEFINKTMV